MQKIKSLYSRAGAIDFCFFLVYCVKDQKKYLKKKRENIEKLALETCTLTPACTVIMKKFPSAQK